MPTNLNPIDVVQAEAWLEAIVNTLTPHGGGVEARHFRTLQAMLAAQPMVMHAAKQDVLEAIGVELAAITEAVATLLTSAKALQNSEKHPQETVDEGINIETSAASIEATLVEIATILK